MRQPAPHLRPLLWMTGVLYAGAVRCRNGLYEAGLLKAFALRAPVVSVGNVTVGGTGKTPLVIHIARLLENCGATPALLTRGYMRASRGMRIIGPEASATAREVGDEPALIRRRCPPIWLGVNHDRYLAGLEIERRCRNPVFILDDGFQHRRLRRDLDILVIDTTQRLESNRVVPLGTLREPSSSLRRAGIVVVTGGGTPDGHLERLCPGAPVFTCKQEIGAVIPFPQWHEGGDAAEAWRGGPVFLVAGIGNPKRFLADVKKAGLEVRGTRWLRDHGRLTTAEWRACWREAQRAGAAAVVTTEKDAIKLARPPDVPLHVAVQSTRILEQDSFAEIIAGLAGRRT